MAGYSSRLSLGIQFLSFFTKQQSYQHPRLRKIMAKSKIISYNLLMDLKLLETIKITAIQALVSDDDLMDRLILKGGNALDLVHKIAERASFDLDFSMKGSFDTAQQILKPK